MADKPNDEKKPTEVVAPNKPATDDPKIVDRSAPADDNINEVKTGDRKGEGELAERQPGDPKVKVQREDGTVEERDATDEDLENISKNDGIDTVQTNDELPAPADTDGQIKDEDAEPTVKLENPTGKVVEVLESDVVKRHMFSAGFKLIDGEDYSDEITNEQQAFEARLKARGISSDHDRSDPGQSKYKTDVERRKGTKKVVASSKADKPADTQKTETKPAARTSNSRTAKALGK